MREFDQVEELKLGRALEKHHGIFNCFWSLVRPRFSKAVPTAAVAFNKAGDCIDFLINPDFWAAQNEEQKQFIISHECLHVLLSHGLRAVKMQIEPNDKGVANVAMDVVVNSLLTDRFGYDREQIDPIRMHKFKQRVKGPDGQETEEEVEKGPCRSLVWRDNVLKDQELPPNRSFEYYFYILMQNREQLQFGDSMDDHSGLPTLASGRAADQIKDMVEGMSQDELESLKELMKREAQKNVEDFTEIFADQTGKSTGNQAGDIPGTFWQHVKLTPVVKKKKWETVINHWVRKLMSYKEEEQWAHKARRAYNIQTDCFIPSDIETEEANNKKVTLALFQDTSGSCVHLAERFFNAARSIPTTRFDIHAYCFDTRVFKIDLKKGELQGFGGTCFKVIDEEVRRLEKELGTKVHCFVLSDGYGSPVQPEHPERWYWFLSENYRDCIPPECHIYDLNNFL